jgi:hypothetical protein
MQMNPMRHDGTSDLFAYWNRLRGTRAAPERKEIEPASIGSRLADTFILQAAGASEPGFRLAGTRICSIHGRELKGQPFISLWRAKDRSDIARLVKNCMTNKAVVQLNYEGRSIRGRKALFKLILLPLASEANERHLMGMIIALGRPFWLESDAIVENRIQAVSIVDPHHSAVPKRGDPVKQEFETIPPLPFARTISSRKVGHLRVFDGGKIGD